MCSVAFLPIMKAKHEERKTAAYKQATEVLLHLSIARIFHQEFLALQWSGTTLVDGAGEQVFGYPIIGAWATDHPEREKLALVRSCCFCKLIKSRWATRIMPPLVGLNAFLRLGRIQFACTSAGVTWQMTVHFNFGNVSC